MPARSIDLEPLRDTIETYLQQGLLYDIVCSRLLSEHDVRVSVRTLKKRLAQWGKRRRLLPDTIQHCQQVIIAEYQKNRSDANIRHILSKPEHGGHTFTSKQLYKLRLNAGLGRRQTVEEKASERQGLCNMIREVLDEGHTENLGYRLMTVLLRGRGCQASR